MDDFRDLGEFSFVRITLGTNVRRGRVISASNYGNRNWISNDPPDWYIEFRDIDDDNKIIPGGGGYLKQWQDGYGKATIEFSSKPI